MRRRIFNDDHHPEIVLSLANLARSLEASRKATEAEDVYREILRIRKAAVLGVTGWLRK